MDRLQKKTSIIGQDVPGHVSDNLNFVIRTETS